MDLFVAYMSQTKCQYKNNQHNRHNEMFLLESKFFMIIQTLICWLQHFLNHWWISLNTKNIIETYLQLFYLDPKCVFWNTTSNDWSEEGCELLDHNPKYTRCFCTHLTNFAVIMDVNGNLDDQKNVSNRSKFSFNLFFI